MNRQQAREILLEINPEMELRNDLISSLDPYIYWNKRQGDSVSIDFEMATKKHFIALAYWISF
jgi:hypothetical protein